METMYVIEQNYEYLKNAYCRKNGIKIFIYSNNAV